MLVHSGVPACCALVVFLVILLGILNFSFLKSVFSVTRIRFRTYGYLFSILTFALPNGLSPARFAFCLGIFVGWIDVVWQNIFSSWTQQKSWSAVWAVVTLVFSLDFRQPIVHSIQKRKIPPTRNRTGTWGCLPLLQSSALPTEQSAGIQAFCLIDLFG